jgi:diacylglycerol O-acyltransferase
MSDADALMWRNEKDPLLRSTITAVAILDRAPDHELLTQRVDRATRVIPRLRQRVVHSPLSVAPPRWEIDPNFDLRYHLRWFRAAESDNGIDAALRAAEPIAMQGFDRARPLWELTVIDGLPDGQAATILKLHHAISDGVGAVEIAMNLFDVERDPAEQPAMPDEPQPAVLGMGARMVDAFDHESRRLLGIAKRLPSTAADAISGSAADPVGSAQRFGDTVASMGRMFGMALRPVSPVMVGRSLSVRFDAISVPLAEMKAAARKADGRLNDAFVAAAIGGLRRYHEHHGSPVSELRMTMPINVRSEENADLAGNAFAPARFLVPLDIADPLERMRVINALVARQRAEPAMAVLDPMALIVHRLPTTVSTALFQSMLRGVDFVTSNVPGAPIPLFLAGSAVVAQYPFGPLSSAAANLTLLSYEDNIHVGINSDTAAVPDSDVFLSCLVDSFDEIRKLA